MENARLQVQYATIDAPIAGRTGALQVHEGDLVKANDTALVLINRIQPIDVASRLKRAGGRGDDTRTRSHDHDGRDRSASDCEHDAPE